MRLSGRLMLSALLRISTSQRSGTVLSSGRNGGNEMNKKDLINALSRLKVETGSLACLGCGHEHDCGIHGCAIIREAVRALRMSPVYQCQVCDCNGLIERLYESAIGYKYPLPAMLLDAADAIETLTAQLTASEAARTDLGKRLAKAEQELQQYRDAVPVVRCRECEHWKPTGSKAGNSFADMEYIGGCEFTKYCRRENDFCSYGKRKEGDDHA